MATVRRKKCLGRLRRPRRGIATSATVLVCLVIAGCGSSTPTRTKPRRVPAAAQAGDINGTISASNGRHVTKANSMCRATKAEVAAIVRRSVQASSSESREARLGQGASEVRSSLLEFQTRISDLRVPSDERVHVEELRHEASLDASSFWQLAHEATTGQSSGHGRTPHLASYLSLALETLHKCR